MRSGTHFFSHVTLISAEKAVYFRTFWTWNFGIMYCSKADLISGEKVSGRRGYSKLTVLISTIYPPPRLPYGHFAFMIILLWINNVHVYISNYVLYINMITLVHMFIDMYTINLYDSILIGRYRTQGIVTLGIISKVPQSVIVGSVVWLWCLCSYSSVWWIPVIESFWVKTGWPFTGKAPNGLSSLNTTETHHC